jgi:transposase-like protein
MHKSYQKYCPKCGSSNTIKKGFKERIQIYRCKDCNHKFHNQKRKSKVNLEEIWNDFVFHKQTIRELIKTYNLDKETLQNYLEEYIFKEKDNHTPREIYLVVDATYFGKRTDGTSWGVVLFRDSKRKENLWWKFVHHESFDHYLEGRVFLEEKGYKIVSVTMDGFKGNLSVFKGIPIQICLYHLKRMVIRNISLKPQTEAGQVLLALVKELPRLSEDIFTNRIKMYHVKYIDFLYEKTYHPSGDWSYTHEGVQLAYKSVTYWFKYLFTYRSDRNIPSTSNTCEGHFSHLKDVIRIHRGLSKEMKQKVINSIFLESTIAPKDK